MFVRSLFFYLFWGFRVSLGLVFLGGVLGDGVSCVKVWRLGGLGRIRKGCSSRGIF